MAVAEDALRGARAAPDPDPPRRAGDAAGQPPAARRLRDHGPARARRPAAGADHRLPCARVPARERARPPHREPQRLRRLRAHPCCRRLGGVPALRALRGGRRGSSTEVAPSCKAAARAAGFTPKSPVIEISGVCTHCSAARIAVRRRDGVDAAAALWHCVAPKETRMIEAGPQERRQSVAVDVGGVMVGGGAPIVVQSMTNTDTADVEGTVAAGGGARARRLRARAHHGRPRRGGGGGAAHPGPAAADGRRRADRRRLPLHRPQAARRSSGLRRGARQVPHQSGQCRLQGEEGPPVRRHRRDRDQARQAGAHRRQLGLARPGAAHPADGRERALERARSTRAR